MLFEPDRPVAFNPDAELVRSGSVVVSSDSVVLDRCPQWVYLSRWIVDEKISAAWIFPMSPD